MGEPSSKEERSASARLPTEDEVQLHMWQKAVFLDSGNGGRETADSLRLRMAQLDYHTLTERLSGHCTSHLHILMKDYLQQYSRVVDERDETKGMNNFTSPALALAAGNKNDCKSWKSGLTFESVMEMPELKAILTEDKDPSPNISGCTSTLLSERKHCQQRRPLSSTAELSQEPTTSNHGALKIQYQDRRSTQVQPVSGRSGDSTRNPTQLQRGPFTSSDSRQHDTANIREERQRPSMVYNRSGRQLTTTNDEGAPHSKRARMLAGNSLEGSKERDDYDNGERKNQAFITARDQHHINQQKKFGGGGGRSVNTNCYGTSKRSLGTRRTAGSRFVPPVKQDNEDYTDRRSKFDETVRSRVMTHGGGSNSSGGGGSNLPPELEGNERLRNIEPKMVELIINEIMDSGAPVQWDDIAGLHYAKESIKEIVVWPMMRPDLFTGLRGPPKGILLFGPPGTGKTLIGKCIASQVEATFFSISASSLTSKWIGEGEKMVRALFAVARCYQPAVVFIDEIDSLLSQRSDTEHESSRRIKTEFLVQLDGATTSAEDRLLVIGATNRPQEIDEAARRRLVKRLYISLPDGQARRQIVDNLMRQQPFFLSEQEAEEISQRTDGYSGADMTNLCREAAYGPVREAAGSLQHISAEEMRPVNFADFEAALKVVKPSVSKKDLDLYIDWNKQFGCGK